jgi:hypothetical protein
VIRLRQLLAAAGLLAVALPTAHPADAEDPRAFVQFVREFDGGCVRFEGDMILVKNTHPSRRIHVRMERYHMGVNTGDRSRSDLAPGAEGEPLGCSRTQYGPQEWKLVRAEFME